MTEDRRRPDASDDGEDSRFSSAFHPDSDDTVEQIHDGAGAWPSEFDDPLDDAIDSLTPAPTDEEIGSETFTDESFWLDARPGHGAQSVSEDWVRANHGPVSHDDRAVTRTTFYPSDVDSVGPGQLARKPREVRSWERLASWNDGEGAPERATQNFNADKRRWIETFGTQLDCTSYQIDRAKWIIKRLDLSPFQGAHIPVENVILGILSLLMDADVPTTLPRNLAETGSGDAVDELDIDDVRAVGRPMMQDLLADLEMDRRDLKRVRQILRKNASELLKPECE